MDNTDSGQQMDMSPAPEALTPTPEARPTTPTPPALPPRSDKLALLLIYIHGFKGNETSFKDFPTHFQEAIRSKLKNHTVHTHIYPKYKTKRQFSVATVNFCEWLRNTLRSYHRPLNSLDVVLIGHSMGGSLASEAIILLSRVTFQHNIIGILGLDVPWLGVHPHVVASGVTGLVKTNKHEKIPMDRPNALSPDPSMTSLTTESTLSLPETMYSETASSSQTSLGDTLSLQPLPSRTPSPKPKPQDQKKATFKETFTKTVTAIYNNRHDLGGAAPRYLWSHLEYGHILLDPAELKAQYDQLRTLPVKFANYYSCIPREGKGGLVFCSLPESVARSMDGWEGVEMPRGMDEPTAHSAIFVPEVFPGYGKMVEDMAGKVASWEK